MHNIHFRTTIADIESVVPPGVLAPLEHNAQGIHILCHPSNGKTLPYAYVECISTQAAEHLVAKSDGKYLAGRRVAFRPVTQMELMLDLFHHLRKGSYFKDAILKDPSVARSGVSNHERQLSIHESAGHLDLFTESDDQHLRTLFDDAVLKSTSGETTQVSHAVTVFSYPTERPFARLASMIVKYPCHAIVGPAREAEKQVQTVARMFDCLICEYLAALTSSII